VEEALSALQRAHGTQRNQVEDTVATQIVAKTRDFSMEMVEELKKVTWPDWPQLKNATLVILVFVFIVALIILAMDQITRVFINNLIMGIFAR
jgi:preprotein translocase subunit SecE